MSLRMDCETVRRRECISYEERCIFAQVVAVEPMFLLQRCSASEVEDEVWLFEQWCWVKPLSEATTDVGEGRMTTSVRHGRYGSGNCKGFHFLFGPVEAGFLLTRDRTMNQELLRIVDNIARDKNIDKESIFADLEEAMVSAVRKHFGDTDSEIARSDRPQLGQGYRLQRRPADRYQGAGADPRPDRQAGHDPEDPGG